MVRNDNVLLEIRDLAIGYPKQRQTPLYDGLNLKLGKGTLTCLMGPNGSGKSTLIKTLTGLIPPIRGSIAYRGDAHLLKYARERARTFAVVLTSNPTFGMLRVREVVAIGRHPHTKWTGNFSPRDLEQVQWALEAVHAETLAERWVHTLSDGERQRVMIARALAQETPIIFLDEPTAYLDLPHKIELMHILCKLTRQCGLTLLMSTHELEMALQHADQLWLLGNEGVCASGVPEDLLLSGNLESVFQRDFLSFDRARGVFHSQAVLHSFACLSGDEIAVRWTRNALEKLGIGVSQDSGATLNIEVSGTGSKAEDTYRWTCQNLTNGERYVGESLQGLLTWIRSHRNAEFLNEKVLPET
ncbi:MAG: ABC transporter ATP-binding protein [Puniceicoccaceae bacterium]